MIATMPWMCLQAAVEQILQESDSKTRDEKLEKWRTLKNSELMNVSFVVSRSPFAHLDES